MHLRPVTPNDDTMISILLDEVFDGSSMWKFVKQLRAIGDVACEQLAMIDGQLVGYICFARNSAPSDWWTLAVAAILPEHQREGRGRQMIHLGLEDAKRMGAQAVTVMGVPAYFTRVGFSQLAASNLDLPYGEGQVLMYPIAAGTGRSSTAVRFSRAYEGAAISE